MTRFSLDPPLFGLYVCRPSSALLYGIEPPEASFHSVNLITTVSPTSGGEGFLIGKLLEGEQIPNQTSPTLHIGFYSAEGGG